MLNTAENSDTICLFAVQHFLRWQTCHLIWWHNYSLNVKHLQDVSENATFCLVWVICSFHYTDSALTVHTYIRTLAARSGVLHDGSGIDCSFLRGRSFCCSQLLAVTDASRLWWMWWRDIISLLLPAITVSVFPPADWVPQTGPCRPSLGESAVSTIHSIPSDKWIIAS